MSTQNLREFTDQNFRAEVLESDRPVLVDFWAPWCGPCRALGPVIDELAESVGDAARVGKINVDENSQAAQEYGIASIPAVLVFQRGEVVHRLVGVHAIEKYEEALRASAVA